MGKEVLAIPVNKVVDQKRIIGKMEGRRGGEAQGVADPLKKKHCAPNPCEELSECGQINSAISVFFQHFCLSPFWTSTKNVHPKWKVEYTIEV
jgi:hypothetical protein